MTYLNDIKDGGETEFYYQKLKVKPEKGLTLILHIKVKSMKGYHMVLMETSYFNQLARQLYGMD